MNCGVRSVSASSAVGLDASIAWVALRAPIAARHRAAATQACAIRLLRHTVRQLWIGLFVDLTSFVDFDVGCDRLGFVEVHAFDGLELLRLRPDGLTLANILLRLLETLETHIDQCTIVVSAPVHRVQVQYPVTVLKRRLQLIQEQIACAEI